MRNLRKWAAVCLAIPLAVSLAACGGSGANPDAAETDENQTPNSMENAGEESGNSQTDETADDGAENTDSAVLIPTEIKGGVTVRQDSDSPTGYTALFQYDAANADPDLTVESVSVTGPFQYVDPEQDLTDQNNRYGPQDYQNGMYATNFAPSAGMENGWGNTIEMADEDGDGIYQTEFPISSGSFAYSYIIQYQGGDEPVTIDDPANPSPAKLNPESVSVTGDLTHSIAYGRWDAEKQSDSPDLDYVLPADNIPAGELNYISYKGADGVMQYIGVYTPPGYDAARIEPYKTVYMSHGGGGNETDWFAMGHLDNIMDNLIADGKTEEAVVITMDNAYYNWDFEQIESNVLTKIIPYVETHYNVSTDAADRAFAGLSMGCMTTMHMYFDYPLEFGYFGMFSAADMTAVKENDGLDVPAVMVAVGSCDIASSTILPETDPERLIKYESFVEWLDGQNLPNITAYGYIPGAHDWFTWSQCFYHFATEFLWK